MVLSCDLIKIFPWCVQTFLNKNSFFALVSICIRFWVRLSVMLIPASFNFFVFKDSVSNVIPGKLDDDRPWLFVFFKFSYPMTSVYINNCCELFLQRLIQDFRHDNIGIFALTFLYTMYQTAISTRLLLMPVNGSI